MTAAIKERPTLREPFDLLAGWRRQVRWPLCIALLLALALHIRLLYRAPVNPPARTSASSVAIRMLPPQPQPDGVTTAVAEAPQRNHENAAPLLTRTVAAPASAPAPVAAPAAASVAAPRRAASVPTGASAAPDHGARASDVMGSAVRERSSGTATDAPVFSMGRLFDLLGLPLEGGNDLPDHRFSGENELPAAPDYLTNQQVEVGPQPTDEVALVYPELANGSIGVVVLRLLISEIGQVDDAAVIKATPADVFDGAAIMAFMKARFAPATIGGVAVKSQITIEVEFVPNP